MQRSSILIKPDGVRRHLIGEIIRRFEEAELVVEALELIEPDAETIEKHYPLSNHDYIMGLGHRDLSQMGDQEKEELYQKNYQIVQRLHKYVLSGPIVKMILSGAEDTIQKVRDIVGKTDPAASPKGSLRGDLGIDSFVKSDAEERAVENLVHASGTPEEAEQEIKLWFSDK